MLYHFSASYEASPEAFWPTEAETITFGLARREASGLLVRFSAMYHWCNAFTQQQATLHKSVMKKPIHQLLM